MLLSLCGFLRGRFGYTCQDSYVSSIFTKSHITITKMSIISIINNYILRSKEMTLLSCAYSKSLTELCSELGFEHRFQTLSLMFILWKCLLFLHWVRDGMLPIICHSGPRSKFSLPCRFPFLSLRGFLGNLQVSLESKRTLFRIWFLDTWLDK